MLAVLAAAAIVLPGGSAVVRQWAKPGPAANLHARVVKLARADVFSKRVAPNQQRFRYFGAHPAQVGPGFPDKLFLAPDNVYAERPPWFVTFKVRGSFRILTKGGGGQYRLIVDNRYATPAPVRAPPPNGNLYALSVRLSGSHTVVVEMSGNFYFGGILGVASRARFPLGPRVIFMGDSFTEPTGSNAPFTGYATLTAFKLGWGDVWASGAGGTGYLNNGPPGRVNFVRRFKRDVLRYHPDVLVLAGGINDQGRFPATAIAAAAHSLVKACGCRTIILSPWWPAEGSAPQEIIDVRDALQDVAQRDGAGFIDVSGWRYPTIDGTHPTQRGHGMIASRLAAAIRGLKVDGHRLRRPSRRC